MYALLYVCNCKHIYTYINMYICIYVFCIEINVYADLVKACKSNLEFKLKRTNTQNNKEKSRKP